MYQSLDGRFCKATKIGVGEKNTKVIAKRLFTEPVTQHQFYLQEITARTNATNNYLPTRQISRSAFGFNKTEEIIHIYEKTRDKTDAEAVGLTTNSARKRNNVIMDSR